MKRIECLLVLVFMMGSVLGIEGVSPGSYEIEFEPELERDFVFDFVLDGKEELMVLGELSEYVVLDKEFVFGRESVVVKLKLPERWNSFGINNIRILAGDVVGIIKINVPYPEKYIELSLAVPNVNVGENVPVNLKIFNFWGEGLNVSPTVDIYLSPRDSNGMTSAGLDDSGEPEDKVVFVLEGDVEFVGVFEVGEYVFSLDSVNYSGGNYLAVARVYYEGEMFEARDYFRLGKFDIRILNYTREVRGGDIERFEIEVESLYDGEMKEVYAEVRGDDIEGFDSLIVSLLGWEKKKLVGYIDTKGLEGRVLLNIDVYYDGRIESKVVSVYVEKRSYLVFLVVGVLLFVLSGFFVWKFFGKKSK